MPNSSNRSKTAAPAAPSSARQVIASVDWIAPLGSGVIDALAADARLRRFGTGQLIGRAGESSGVISIVAQGRVEFSRSNAAGKRMVLSYGGAPHLFGLLDALGSLGSINDTRAVEDTWLLTITRDSFMRTLIAERALAEAVFALLGRRMRRLTESASDQVLTTSPMRIARLLLSLRSRAQKEAALSDPAVTEAVIDMSQEALAEMLGFSRQRMNRELKRLEAAGLVRLAYSKVWLCDPAAMKELATGTRVV